MLKISNLKISVKEKVDILFLENKVKKALKCNKVWDLKILKKSIDARDKTNVFYNFSVAFKVEKEEKYLKLKNVTKHEEIIYQIKEAKPLEKRPIIVGFGPAGMMAGLTLARAKLKPIIFERGYCVEKRQEAINTFWSGGKFDKVSNVQFGEGGAGTFSDGKLTTGIKDKRCSLILQDLVKFGAPSEILYEAKPHIGTDKLVDVVRNIRKEIISLGGEVHFNSQVEDIIVEKGRVCSVVVNQREIECDNLILAIGHSARDTFSMLKERKVEMVQKPFAMGVRIEHKQEMINFAQYGEFSKYLPNADYKLVAHLPNGRSAYTFCMCPGGVVVASNSEEKTVVTNGMSYYKRDKENANSALLIGINPSDFPREEVLAGVLMQRQLEKKAFEVGGGNYFAPAQLVGDFLENNASTSARSITPSYKPGVRFCDIKKVFPEFMNQSFELALYEMEKKIKGFAFSDAVMTAVESRSSSPIRITRGEDFVSTNVKGLYPCGEGCGYAGGIMSACVDGIRCSEALIQNNF